MSALAHVRVLVWEGVYARTSRACLTGGARGPRGAPRRLLRRVRRGGPRSGRLLCRVRGAARACGDGGGARAARDHRACCARRRRGRLCRAVRAPRRRAARACMPVRVRVHMPVRASPRAALIEPRLRTAMWGAWRGLSRRRGAWRPALLTSCPEGWLVRLTGCAECCSLRVFIMHPWVAWCLPPGTRQPTLKGLQLTDTLERIHPARHYSDAQPSQPNQPLDHRHAARAHSA